MTAVHDPDQIDRDLMQRIMLPPPADAPRANWIIRLLRAFWRWC